MLASVRIKLTFSVKAVEYSSAYQSDNHFDRASCVNITEDSSSNSNVAGCGSEFCVSLDRFTSIGVYPRITCVNINECNPTSLTYEDCGNGFSIDLNGVYKCICDLGYELNSTTCAEIIEFDIDGDICGVDIF